VQASKASKVLAYLLQEFEKGERGKISIKLTGLGKSFGNSNALSY
jgi:hypothetical protein